MGVVSFDNGTMIIESTPINASKDFNIADACIFRGTKEEGKEYKLNDVVLNKNGDVEIFNGASFNLVVYDPKMYTVSDRCYENKPGELEELKCTNCSSPLKMIPGSSICTCDYCGSTYRFK